MRKTAVWLLLVCLALGGLLLVVSRCTPPPIESDSNPAVASRPRKGGTDVTFYVAADTHIGYRNMVWASEKQIAEMNRLPGKHWPRNVGGTVDPPRGVLLAGDLTDTGTEAQWRQFAALYGRDGTDGKLQFPVYLGSGNHDRWTDEAGGVVLREIRRRHGSEFYSWDWDDLHLICLDEAPTEAGLRWLGEDLARTGRDAPIVVFLHFSLTGPYSDSNWFGKGREKPRMVKMLRPFNVIGIFHGHYHYSEHYQWEGFDVYNVGSPKHSIKHFAVVRVTDARLTVVSRDWFWGLWRWSHVKAINRPPAP